MKLNRNGSSSSTNKVTAPTKDIYKKLAMAKTHGQQFFVTGGDHTCTDDVFKAFEYKERLGRIELLKKEKRERKQMEDVEDRAEVILAHKLPLELMNVPQLCLVTIYYKIPRKEATAMKKSQVGCRV